MKVQSILNVGLSLILLAGIGVSFTGYVDLVRDREGRDAKIQRWFDRTNDAAEYEADLAGLYAGRNSNGKIGAGTIENPAGGTVIAGKDSEIAEAKADLTAANAALTIANEKMGRMVFALPDFGKCGEGEKSVVARWTDTCDGIPVACETDGDATTEASANGYESSYNRCESTQDGVKEKESNFETGKCNASTWGGYVVDEEVTCGVALAKCRFPTSADATMATLTSEVVNGYEAGPATAQYCWPLEKNEPPAEPAAEAPAAAQQ
ncbi:MAG: hypothetical protein V1664_01245 [Candidatus Uhrbacteria bacterium]